MLDHLSVQCDDQAASRLFYERLHEPREWPEYHPGYYDVEAVMHQ
jgi:hypothetical protein